MDTNKNSVRESIPKTRAEKKRLRKLRLFLRNNEISMAELAKRCNLSRQCISLRFSLDDCKLSDMEQMAEALGYEFTWSLKRKEEADE